MTYSTRLKAGDSGINKPCVTNKGGFGKVYEYTGEGAESLEVPERATIANMGATTSIFAIDENVQKFLKAQGRENDYIPLAPDNDSEYA